MRRVQEPKGAPRDEVLWPIRPARLPFVSDIPDSELTMTLQIQQDESSRVIHEVVCG